MAVGLHALKTAVVTLIGLSANLKLSAALRSGLLLSQGGEFAFVIFALAQQHGLLLPTQASEDTLARARASPTHMHA